MAPVADLFMKVSTASRCSGRSAWLSSRAASASTYAPQVLGRVTGSRYRATLLWLGYLVASTGFFGQVRCFCSWLGHQPAAWLMWVDQRPRMPLADCQDTATPGYPWGCAQFSGACPMSPTCQ